MMHLAVIVPCFPRALQGQFCPRYPAALCHRRHNDKPLTFPCRLLYGRTFQFGEGWHSNENTVRFWTPSPRVPKEADTRCYAYTTAYATMTPLCNVCCARSKMPPPSPL